jgi:Uma2 family endonuclease
LRRRVVLWRNAGVASPDLIDDERLAFPRAILPLPLELVPPPGFDPDRLETWPRIDGRLEWVGGRLLYMPPCGGRQQFTVADVVGCLVLWGREHPDLGIGTNEAGMKLAGDVRGADAAVWRRADLSAFDDRVLHVPPLLAVEVSGRDDTEAMLRDKARWYLDVGVSHVWIVLVEKREVVVLTGAGETRHAVGDTLPPHPDLPGLAPAVADLFRQLLAAET